MAITCLINHPPLLQWVIRRQPAAIRRQHHMPRYEATPRGRSCGRVQRPPQEREAGAEYSGDAADLEPLRPPPD
eukprot:6985406-Pyramimonas_sp.AAC.1